MKTCMEIFKNYFKDYNIRINIITYLIIFGAGICCIGQIVILNQGLKHYPSLHMLPLYQGTFILIGSITSVIFFHEYNNMKLFQFIIYPFGIILTIYGLIYTAIHSKTDDIKMKEEKPIYINIERKESKIEIIN